MAKTLLQYITDAQRLLHTSTYNFWTQAELNDYVNKARKMVNLLGECNRSIQEFNIIAATGRAQATYDFATMLTSGRAVVDIKDVVLNYTGTSEYQLRYLPFQDAIRTSVWQYRTPSTPTHFTIMGKSLIILPWPNTAYPSSWTDCILDTVDLSNTTPGTTDVDNELFFPFTESVGYYVAYLAKLKDQRRQDAEEFYKDFTRSILASIGAQSSRKIVGR